jgi:hypothetical protein
MPAQEAESILVSTVKKPRSKAEPKSQRVP